MLKKSSENAIELLKNDHSQVKADFKKFESLGSKAYASKKKLAESICADLFKHTIIEEEIFYPAVRKGSKKAQDMIDEAVVEHESAKELISQIQSMSPEEELFDARVMVLSEQIEHHVKEEEEEIFPLVQKMKLDLIQLGEQMAARKELL
ncbi:hemerythrin domain-containing protein [Candidatus Nitrotoga sp. M5]|uniref:hemerythrin domain-containing protein n=1 Tax=Candidatus Nitrotoga sp. M5 TaxID=2890409 RepID=UPI001EF36CC6|nr:hemerythrin domain-containing protein [Candidatus Nitrotoga sp. M5]CAH1386458.1 Hemerythrin domain-containing protein [Candidatus Nitrotoga sp. M5]